MPVVLMQASDFWIEVLHELRAVVGKNGLKRVRKDSVTIAKNSLAAKEAWL
jgi:hypothetical protein